mmetsp:Transcript_27363/g.63127  ORF Transcript_27363/g.63127 Transcript_27363/m.63127 type:complete len:1734 (-) Transcript_27363:25-5226(-)
MEGRDEDWSGTGQEQPIGPKPVLEIVRSPLQAEVDVEATAEAPHETADAAADETRRRSLLQEKRRVQQELEAERKVSNALEDQVVALREQVSVGRRQLEMQEQLQAEESKRQVESLQREVKDLRKSESEARSELAAMQSAEQDWYTKEARLSGELEEAAGALQRQLQVASSDRRRSQDLEQQLTETRKREEELRAQLLATDATGAEPATVVNELPEGTELCEMDGDDGGVECYHLDHSSGRLYTAEAPYVLVGVLNADGEVELLQDVQASSQALSSRGGELELLDVARPSRKVVARSAVKEEESEELRARALAYEAEIDQLTALLASEKQTSAKLRVESQEHGMGSQQQLQEIQDLWQANATLKAQIRQEQQARQLAEQAHQHALELLEQQQEAKKGRGSQETTATVRTLRQAEQLQQYKEQLAVCNQEIAILRAERDELADTQGRRPRPSAPFSAEQSEPGDRPVSRDEALRDLSKAEVALVQTRAHAAERESQLMDQINKQEQQLQALQQEMMLPTDMPDAIEALKEGFGDPAADTDAPAWMEQLASRNQQIKLLQARVGSYAEQQQQLEEMLSRQMQENAALAEQIEQGTPATLQAGAEQSGEVGIAEKTAIEEALRAKEKDLEMMRAKLGMQAEREQHILADVAGQLQELETLRDELHLLRDGIPSPTRGRPSQVSVAESPPPAGSPEEKVPVAKMAKEVETLKARIVQQAEQEHQMRSELAVQTQLARDLQLYSEELETTMEKWKLAGKSMPRDGAIEEEPVGGRERTKAEVALESELAAKSKELDHLRKKLGKQAEREQEILERLSMVEQEALQAPPLQPEPKGKENVEKLAKTADGAAVEKANARIKTLERSLTSKAKELEQLRSRLCVQTEDEQVAKSELASARLETEHWRQEAEKIQKAWEAQETSRRKHEVSEDVKTNTGAVHAKDLELEQLRGRLGRLAEREQAAVEQANLQQGEVDALRAENAALQEVAAVHMAQQRQAVSASVVQPISKDNAEVVAAKSREVDQLRGRLAAQAERENEIMTKLAMKEEEVAQLHHEKADAVNKLAALQDRKGGQANEPSAMERLRSQLSAKEQELEAMRSRAFQERVATGEKLQSAEERASRSQVDLEQLLLEKKEWQAREEELLKSHAKAIEVPTPWQPEKKAVELAKRETEELRARWTRECAANAERQQKDRDEVFQLQQRLLETEAELEKLQRVVKLTKYQESMRKVQQEEEEEGEENLRYESYDTGFVGDSHATRKKREQKDAILQSMGRERELMRRQRDRVDQICEFQAEQVAELRKAAGGDSLLKVETLLAYRSHELEQTRKQLDLVRTQLERREQSRASEAEASQRLNEELSQHKQDLQAKQVKLNDALRDRDFWQAKHQMLQETQNLLLSELNAERERLKKEEPKPDELRHERLEKVHGESQNEDAWIGMEQPVPQQSQIVQDLEDANEEWKSEPAMAGQDSKFGIPPSRGANFDPDDELSAAKPFPVDEVATLCVEPLLSLPPAHKDAIWNEVDTWSCGPTATQPSTRILGEDASRTHLALRHAIVSVPSAPAGVARSPWRCFLPDSMLRTSGGRTIPASELAVGMMLVGPDGSVQVVAVRWMSAEKHNIVTIPTGRGVFSVVADHWLVAREASLPSTRPETLHDWDAVAAADLKEGAHEVVIHGPDDMCEAAVLTSTRWKSHKSWTVEAEFSSTEEIFMYVQPAALRSGARSSRPQQQRGRPRTPPPLGR